MLQCESKWKNSQLADLAKFVEDFNLYCARPAPRPRPDLVRAVKAKRASLDFYFKEPGVEICPVYLLARHFKVYQIETASDVYPLWLHDNDVPTMQAAHERNPDLGTYLKARSRIWSSNYIAADLRVDIWAARVCLDLYSFTTPYTSTRPSELPRAEIDYRNNGEQVQVWLRQGYNVRDIATKLGVTESFLRKTWKELHITPEHAHAHETEHAPESEITRNREAWRDELRDGVEDMHPIKGKCVRAVESVGEAAQVWGVPFNTAKKRLLVLGWRPYTSVADSLHIRRSYADLNGGGT
jgi:hypothetical protein